MSESWVNERFAQKNEQFAHLLIFGEQPEQFAHIAHFWWSTWAIRSLKKREWTNGSFKKKRQKNVPKIWFYFLSESLVFCEQNSEWAIRSKKERFTHSLIYHERPEQIAHGCSFIISDLSNSLTVAHLSWATLAICSQSLVSPEQSEWIAHSCSFDLSDLRELANSQPCSFVIHDKPNKLHMLSFS